MKDVFIVNTGGTFNKIYNKITGALEVDSNNLALKMIEKAWFASFPYDNIINKDSLEFTNKDRELLVEYVQALPQKKVVIIHGTDTIDLSAKELEKTNLKKTIVLTGAMIPFSISPIEATANLAFALGFAKNANEGVYIAIDGLVAPFDKIRKNKKEGKFELI